jgi:Ca2+-binding EF-hand superfamily protein
VQLAEIKKAFQMVDQDGNGQIDASEVRSRTISDLKSYNAFMCFPPQTL